MLVLVCGLPGTGKSTVSKAVREKIAAELIRTDEIRKRLFGKPDYSEQEKSFVYEQVLRLAEVYLRQNKSVVVDATFYKRESRQKFTDLAARLDVEFRIVECVCDGKIVAKRMKYRTNDPSDADYRIYRKIKEEWEPIAEKHIVINTGKKWEKELDEF